MVSNICASIYNVRRLEAKGYEKMCLRNFLEIENINKNCLRGIFEEGGDAKGGYEF